MPSGRYAVRGRSGDVVGTEDFRCAPGPMGWRYVSEIQRDEPTPHRETVDVVVDASWRIVRDEDRDRVALDPPRAARRTHSKGSETGTRSRWRGDRRCTWTTSRRPSTRSRRTDWDGATDAQTSTSSSSSPSRSSRSRCVSGTSCSDGNTVETPPGTFLAARWRYTALATGWTSELWVADDVVVRYDRAFELISYEAGASGPVPTPP